MGSPISNMLLAQAAPAGDALSGLSPEAQAALRAINGQSGVPQTMPAVGPPPPAANMPAQPPPAAMPGQAPQPGIGEMLINWLSSVLPGNKDLAPKTQATPAPIFSGQQAGDAAIAAQRKREQGQQ